MAEKLSTQELAWDDMFVSLTNFHEIRDLGFLIRNPESTSETIKRFMITHRIPINVYLPVIKGDQVIPGRYLPLYYSLCQYSRYHSLFDHIVQKGCRIGAPPRVESEKHTDLLYICDDSYLEKLVQLGHQLRKEHLIDDLQKRLRMGQSERIVMLYRLGQIHQNVIRGVLQDPYFLSDILSVLVDRIYHLCEHDETNDRELVLKLIHQYQKVIRFALQNGANPNQVGRSQIPVMQYAVDYYLVEIVEEILRHSPKGLEKINLVFHKDKNQTLTAIMRQLFNDKRYDDLCRLMKRPNIYL